MKKNILVFTLTIITFISIINIPQCYDQIIIQIQAASPYLTKSLTLKNIRSYKLKVRNTKKKVKWRSSNKKVATVTSKGLVKAVKNGKCYIYAKVSRRTYKCKVTVKSPSKTYRISIPTYSQHKYGYPKGCEGVSLYMAMRGKGYLKGMSLKSFMNSMPLTETNPNYGFVGDPTKGSGRVNTGKRTTIYPKPLAKWGSQYGKIESLQGKSLTTLKAELRKKNPIVVWMTTSWETPQWKKYSWGKSVTNNHAICLVGYSTRTGSYLVNDCGGKTKVRGTYWVSKNQFEKIYNARKYAVVVR